MYINTNVVRALMTLRGIHLDTVAQVAGISKGLIERWLLAKGQNHEEAVPVDIQFDILQYVGVKNGAPRTDIVHYWHIQEPFFGDINTTYRALSVVLTAFGDAAVTFLTREVEPGVSFKNESFFGLKFPGFVAVLRVTGAAMASLKFGPEKVSGLYWAEGGHGVLMDEEDYLGLASAEITPGSLTKTLTMVPEMMAWEKMVEMAKSLKLDYAEVGEAIKSLAESKQALPSPEPAPVEKESRMSDSLAEILRQTAPRSNQPAEEFEYSRARREHRDISDQVTGYRPAATEGGLFRS